MKKIFTLLAAMVMAVGAMAQTVSYAVSATPNCGDKVELTGITMIYGNDAADGTTSGAWTANKDATKTVKIEGTDYTFTQLTQGKNNPKVDGNNPTAEACIPTTGAYFVFNPTTDGTIYVVAMINAGSTSKQLWLVEDGKAIDIVVDNATYTAVTNAGLAAKADPAIVKITAKAGSTYYLYNTGSKMCLYGFVFVPGAAQATPPTISIPETLIGYVNSPVTITATVSGTPTPSIQWYDGNGAIEGATTASYTFTPTAEGTYTFYATAENTEGNEESNKCVVTVTDPNIVIGEEDYITFDSDILPAKPHAVNIISGCLSLAVTNADGKMVIEDSGANWGDANSHIKIAKRLKTGGKTTSTNNLKLTTTKGGKLHVYARFTDSRHLVVKQNDVELANWDINETAAIKIPNEAGDGEITIQPIRTVENVEAGEISIEFPDNSIYIYGFAIGDIITGIENVNVAAPVQVKKSLRNGQIVIETAKGTFNAVGAQVK